MNAIPFSMTRRGLLAGACCAAASPLLTKVTFAAAPGDNRFIAIVLRGAMDGLDLVQPYGDPILKTLRPDLALSPDAGLIDLDGFFGLNPAAAGLADLWKAKELSFVHAVSTPYRDGRSHFDGQDILETGAEGVNGERTGWLNRSLSVIPGSGKANAIDVAASSELILSGTNRAANWSSDADLSLNDDQIQFLKRLYRSDPAFSAAIEEATSADKYSDLLRGGDKGRGVAATARLAAGFLLKEFRIASFSINGWDTHFSQKAQFAKIAADLADAITTIKATLGPEVWSKTVVVAMTEFGRTARQNGTGGTDHGTGGVAVMAGGAVPGGRVIGKWPGLDDASLFEQRDLMPTADVREVAAAALYSQFGVSASALGRDVFPGLQFSGAAPYI